MAEHAAVGLTADAIPGNEEKLRLNVARLSKAGQGETLESAFDDGEIPGCW